MLTPEEQIVFLRSADNVRQAAELHLRAHRSQQSVVAFVSNLQRGVTRIIQTAIDRGVKVACHAGCSHCCSARVEAMAPEVFRIARELSSQSPGELNQLVQHLNAHVSLQNEAVQWNQRLKCPFLKNGLCSIYDIRPSACRKAHSLDVRKCQANASEIPQDLRIVVSVEAMAKGTSDAYGRLGFDASSHELIRAVLLTLADPSAESRWYNGDAVFAQADWTTINDGS